jgi:hypothetical protein
LASLDIGIHFYGVLPIEPNAMSLDRQACDGVKMEICTDCTLAIRCGCLTPNVSKVVLHLNYMLTIIIILLSTTTLITLLTLVLILEAVHCNYSS